MTDLFEPLSFARGPAIRNRMMLAPLTNQQSHADGTLSDEELLWLLMRAQGGFGLVMTAAAYVGLEGKGFEGQIGIHDDACIPGLARLAAALKAAGSLSAVQLFHAGIRADMEASGKERVGPSDDPDTGARGLSTGEVEALIEAFVVAAERAERAGFDGVELHGAHTYILCAFLSSEYNRRSDRYGGSLENRARPIREIIAGVRARCRPDFQLGLRLSAERMGMKMAEVRTLSAELMAEDRLDYLDLSLWDVFKGPEEPEFAGKPLLSWFAELQRGATRLGVAGQVRSAAAAHACLEAGADFVLIGRAGIAHHDFPRRAAIAGYEMPTLPIPRGVLAGEGVSPAFIEYLGTFPGFIEAA